MYSLLKWSIFRGHVSFHGCISSITLRWIFILPSHPSPAVITVPGEQDQGLRDVANKDLRSTVSWMHGHRGSEISKKNTLPETNNSKKPENRPPWKKEISIGNHQFFWAMLVLGRVVVLCDWCLIWLKAMYKILSSSCYDGDELFGLDSYGRSSVG